MKKQKMDSEEEEDIDYADMLGLDEDDMEEMAAAPQQVAVPASKDLIPLEVAADVDCSLTRADYDNSRHMNLLKQLCTVLALDLYVEHNEPLRPGEFYFGQYRGVDGGGGTGDDDDSSESGAPVFHL